MTTQNPSAHGYRFLSRWSALTGLAYAGLMVLFITLVLPAGRTGPLPERYVELTAAGREPVLYRLTIAFDMATWLLLGGFLIALVAVLPRALLRSTFIAALSAGALVGFFGACLRLAATTDLGSRVLSAPPDQQPALLQAYLDLQRLVNVSFSAGGLVTGIALVLAASIAWHLTEFPRAATVLMGLGALAHISKGALELATGADLGPLALAGNILMIASFVIIASRYWRKPLRSDMR